MSETIHTLPVGVPGLTLTFIPVEGESVHIQARSGIETVQANQKFTILFDPERDESKLPGGWRFVTPDGFVDNLPSGWHMIEMETP